MGALLRETWSDFQRHNSQWLAAALAYFAAFAIAPLIIVIVEIAGFFLHAHQGALDLIYRQLHAGAGAGEGAVRVMVAATFDKSQRSPLAEAIEWILFVIASTGLFNALQYALDTIWDVPARRSTLLRTLAERAYALPLVLGVALLLVTTMALNAALTVALAHLPHPHWGFGFLVKAADFVFSVALLWIAFALVFELLPHRRVAWRNAWIGGGFTALFFAIGQFVLGTYLGRIGVTSAYGAFGSFVALLIWVNYSAQIVLLGAEFTHVYARRSEGRSENA